ncbi:hypothetical protein MBLNU457_4620t2 [Dothideomycetes sp. NU457]
MPNERPANKRGPTLDTLPAEILDQIFGNLLKITDHHCYRAGTTDGEKKKPAKGKRTNTAKNTQDTAGKVATSTSLPILPIHTAILLVNRCLSEAGRRYLYTDNRLVLISYSETCSRDLVRDIITSFITTKHLQNFEHHVLDFTFKLEPTVVCQYRVTKIQTGTYLSRECDLRPFLHRLQCFTYGMPADHIYLLSPPSSASEPTSLRYKLRSAEMQWISTITIRETPLSLQYESSEDRRTMEARLLQRFKDLGGFRGKLDVVGAQAQYLWHAVSSRMTARIVSVDAIGWRFLHDLLAWEDALAKLIEHPTCLKPFTMAPPLEDSYRDLLSIIAHNQLTNDRDGIRAIADPQDLDMANVDTWYFAIRVLQLDVVITHLGLVMSGNPNPGILDTDEMTELTATLWPITIDCDAGGSKRDYFPLQQMAIAMHLMAVMWGHNCERNQIGIQLQMLWQALELEPDDMLIIADLKRVVEHNEGRVCRKNSILKKTSLTD